MQGPAKLPVKKDKWKGLRHGPGKGPKNNLTRGSKNCLVMGLEAALEKEICD